MRPKYTRPGIIPWVAWIIVSGVLVWLRFEAESGTASTYAAGFWLALFAWMVLAAWMMGWLIRRHPWGAWISSRNKTSLSRFQAGLWFIMLLSVVLASLCLAWSTEGLDEVGLDRDAVIQGGVAATGLAGTGIILSGQSRLRATPKALLEDSVEAAAKRPEKAIQRILAELDEHDPESDAEGRANQRTRVARRAMAQFTGLGFLEKQAREPSQELARMLDVSQPFEESRVVNAVEFLDHALALATPQGVSREDLIHALFEEFEEASGPDKDREARKHVRGVLQRYRRGERIDVEHLLAAETSQHVRGILALNPHIGDAGLLDMVRGDKIGLAHRFDLGKMQFLGLTLLGLIIYGLATWDMFANEAVAGAVPYPAGLAELAGLGGAGYLAGKLPVKHLTDATTRIGLS